MLNIEVKQGQSLLDIALQHTGDPAAVIAIAIDNDLSITEALAIGKKLIINNIANNRVVKYYTDNKIVPATAATEQDQFKQEGIDFWALTEDFVVQAD